MARVVFKLLFLLTFTTVCSLAQQVIPEKYRGMYEQYKSGLERYNTFLERSGKEADGTICFGAELLAANSNRGEDLLQPRALKSVELSLQRFKELGIQGATIAIGYPILTDSFPHSLEYLAFYKKVSEMVRANNMKLCVKLHVLFAGTVYSSLKVDFTSLTFQKLMEAKRMMAERAINELAPDYLTLGGEPDTEAKLTGLRGIEDPVGYADMVRFILKDLKKGNTLVGVGQGTWVTPDFAKAFARTDIDFINIHVYPFGKKVLEALNQICDAARKQNKSLIMDECWLYKVAPGEGLGVAASANIYRRDSYSFWEPIDRLFLEAMARIARQNRIEYVSPFWSHCFFASTAYDSSDEQRTYAEVNRKFVQAVSSNMISGTFTPLGRYYSELIRKYGSSH